MAEDINNGDDLEGYWTTWSSLMPTIFNPPPRTMIRRHKRIAACGIIVDQGYVEETSTQTEGCPRQGPGFPFWFPRINMFPYIHMTAHSHRDGMNICCWSYSLIQHGTSTYNCHETPKWGCPYPRSAISIWLIISSRRSFCSSFCGPYPNRLSLVQSYSHDLHSRWRDPLFCNWQTFNFLIMSWFLLLMANR